MSSRQPDTRPSMRSNHHVQLLAGQGVSRKTPQGQLSGPGHRGAVYVPDQPIRSFRENDCPALQGEMAGGTFLQNYETAASREEILGNQRPERPSADLGR